ncbi:hypothetical protein [Streptomyces yangpuensis]|uniref:hypothetical protein n=1 Tax=Streptomyces yangpuensis TaxID=1648182 RepID=UPI00364CC2DC
MIHFSFTLPDPDSPWRETWDRAEHANPADISEMDLRYKYFGVRARLTVDDVEVISDRGFVTLVDLALSIAWAGKQIAAGHDSAFNFTEAAEVIRLHADGQRIEMSSSVKPWTVTVARDQLLGEFTKLRQEAHACLITQVPGLAEHPVIRRIPPEQGMPEQ